MKEFISAANFNPHAPRGARQQKRTKFSLGFCTISTSFLPVFGFLLPLACNITAFTVDFVVRRIQGFYE